MASENMNVWKLPVEILANIVRFADEPTMMNLRLCNSVVRSEVDRELYARHGRCDLPGPALLHIVKSTTTGFMLEDGSFVYYSSTTRRAYVMMTNGHVGVGFPMGPHALTYEFEQELEEQDESTEYEIATFSLSMDRTEGWTIPTIERNHALNAGLDKVTLIKCELADGQPDDGYVYYDLTLRYPFDDAPFAIRHMYMFYDILVYVKDEQIIVEFNIHHMFGPGPDNRHKEIIFESSLETSVSVRRYSNALLDLPDLTRDPTTRSAVVEGHEGKRFTINSLHQIFDCNGARLGLQTISTLDVECSYILNIASVQVEPETITVTLERPCERAEYTHVANCILHSQGLPETSYVVKDLQIFQFKRDTGFQDLACGELACQYTVQIVDLRLDIYRNRLFLCGTVPMSSQSLPPIRFLQPALRAAGCAEVVLEEPVKRTIPFARESSVYAHLDEEADYEDTEPLDVDWFEASDVAYPSNEEYYPITSCSPMFIAQIYRDHRFHPGPDDD